MAAPDRSVTSSPTPWRRTATVYRIANAGTVLRRGFWTGTRDARHCPAPLRSMSG